MRLPKRPLRRSKPPRDRFRMEADERAARAALAPHTGNVATAAVNPPNKGKAT